MIDFPPAHFFANSLLGVRRARFIYICRRCMESVLLPDRVLAGWDDPGLSGLAV